ncbi:MAG: YesL family protein [Lachnospiraceae bacterium]|nr:YesL family protein [Lachnospiraceae bacterium]
MAGFNMFEIDNPFNNIMTKIFDVVLLNFLFLVCSIPVITIGASASALYCMTMKMVDDREAGIIKGFFKAFRENFRKSVPMTLMLIVCMALLMADLHILGQTDNSVSMIMYGGCVALLIAVGAVACYAFPLLAKFENTVKGTLVNAAKIAATHLIQTLIILLINSIPVIWILVSPETFAPVFIIWVLTGTGAAAYVNSIFLVKIFDKLSAAKS